MEIRPKSTVNSSNRPTLTELRTLLTSLSKDACQTRDLASRKERCRMSRGAPRSFGDGKHVASG